MLLPSLTPTSDPPRKAISGDRRYWQFFLSKKDTTSKLELIATLLLRRIVLPRDQRKGPLSARVIKLLAIHPLIQLPSLFVLCYKARA